MCNFIFVSSTDTFKYIILNKELNLLALYHSKRHTPYILELAFVGEF